MRPTRRVLGGVLVLCALGGVALAAWSRAGGWRPALGWWASPDQTEGALETLGDYGQVPDFALTERSGRGVTRADLRGKVWLVNFIYTQDSSRLGPEAGKPALLPAGMQGDRAQVIFASPEDLKRFLVAQC